jgi:hypothetical protein
LIQAASSTFILVLASWYKPSISVIHKEKPSMGKYDTLNMKLTIVGLCIAVLGLILGVAAPFITYRWLDPQLQSLSHRPRFKILTLQEKGPRKVAEFKIKKVSDEDFDKAFAAWSDDIDNGAYSVVITNVGELPAKDALITAQYRTIPASSPPSVTFNPPVLTETSNSGDIQFITIKKPIAAHDKLEIRFSRTPKVIYASTSEFGEAVTLLPQINVPPIVILEKQK